MTWATFIVALLTFGFGYALGRWGWSAISAWFIGAAAVLAAWWESVSGFVMGLLS